MSSWRGEFRLAARLALRVQGGLQKGHGADAGDLQRVLKREKDPRGRALVRLHLEHVLPVQDDLAVEDLVISLPAMT
jgi:hypothetical protein